MSDMRIHSDDHQTWVPRCAGCLPDFVRPHNCRTTTEAFGSAGAPCYCEEEDCVAAQVAHGFGRRKTLDNLRAWMDELFGEDTLKPARDLA